MTNPEVVVAMNAMRERLRNLMIKRSTEYGMDPEHEAGESFEHYINGYARGMNDTLDEFCEAIAAFKNIDRAKKN